MTNKLPTISIKGKSYVMVKDRILAFNENYTNGCIQTEIVSQLDSQNIVVKATVIPDMENPERKFVDYSQATIGQGMVNTTAALENASTSAVGRALAYMGIGVIESVASADEVHKAITSAPTPFAPRADFGSGVPKYKCEICGTNDMKAHKPDCANHPGAVKFKNADGSESFGTQPI